MKRKLDDNDTLNRNSDMNKKSKFFSDNSNVQTNLYVITSFRREEVTVEVVKGSYKELLYYMQDFYDCNYEEDDSLDRDLDNFNTEDELIKFMLTIGSTGVTTSSSSQAIHSVVIVRESMNYIYYNWDNVKDIK